MSAINGESALEVNPHTLEDIKDAGLDPEELVRSDDPEHVSLFLSARSSVLMWSSLPISYANCVVISTVSMRLNAKALADYHVELGWVTGTGGGR